MVIETGIKGLSVTVGTDGVWINTNANTGKHSSFNLNIYANDRESITKQAILDWCAEITKSYNK
ncbi:hypothetical protein KA005_67855 [bacterium]|nr:hypothetical protein [bacterium]